MNTRRTLALCADDFGLSEGVCQGILQLASQARITAVSVLSGSVWWREAARALWQTPGVVDRSVEVGLHFNLTEGRPLSRSLASEWPSFPSLGRLIVRAHSKTLPLAALKCEWQAQWEAFCDTWGRPPDFMDGHQHVHHLPQVRDILLTALANMPPNRPAVRSTGRLPGPGYPFKRFMIKATGGFALAGQLPAQGLRHNTTLWGCYDFQCPHYRELMQTWLASIPSSGALLFCHPGAALENSADPIAKARIRELAYLSSEAFVEDLQQHEVQLGQAWSSA